MLWVSVGDDNVPCAAQDLHQLRGKLLRLSVLGVPDGAGSAPDYQAIAPPDNPFINPDPRVSLVWGLRTAQSVDLRYRPDDRQGGDRRRRQRRI
jgi:glucose/arabinose dehydrogenase